VLDDAVWKSAPVLEHFVQSKPLEGLPASRDTEVRILYDDHAIYVGVRCKDDQVSIARLGRRDASPESDSVWIAFDTQHDKRTAYIFGVNSAGVMSDGIESDGQGATNLDWDGVWDVRTQISADGWTAEFAIPYVTLRFPRVPVQSWGFHVRRYISRFNENDDWNLIRESDATFVGRFEELDGLVAVKPGLSLQFVPYGSATVRASFQDDTLAGREHPQTASAGFDVKYGLTGSLTLDATVNPDFGQVEVDPEVVNLSAFPVYFPEKRPFFLEGTDIFSSAGSLIYTRRIGAPPSVPTPANDQDQVIAIDPVARIFGAAKLSGNLRPGTAVGVLSAWVDQTDALVQNGSGYLGSKSTLVASPMTWFNAARIRQRVGSLSTIGATDTLVIRDGGQTAEVFAADFDARNASDWSASGIVGASSTGICHSGCDPMGAQLSAGRRGGEARAWVDGTYFGAELDPNDMGYLAHLVGNQNITETAHTEFFRPVALGPFSRMSADLSWTLAWDPNAGAGLTDNSVKLDGMNRFRNNVEFGWFAFHSFEREDDVETRLGSVRLYHRQPRDGLWLRLRTNDLRRFWVEPFNYVDSEGGAATWNPGVNFTWLGNRVQLGGKLAWNQWFGRPRWVDKFEGRPLFGDLDLKQFEVDLRTTVAFSRDWTVQVFTQLLRSASHYEQLRELQDPRTLVASMAAPGSYDGDLTSLIVNAVMRWEFHPGSTFYIVYTHNHQVGTTRGDFRFGSALGDLGSSPADNVLAMKLSYLWAL
jgi:hypothetical protein